MIPLHIKKKIEKKFGKIIRYSKDCEVLAISISKYCGETISASTLKRIFDLRNSTSKPRLATLDLISNYAGYNSWNEAIELRQFAINQRITIHSPNGLLILIYLNNNVFDVIFSNLIEINHGDQIIIKNLEENSSIKIEKQIISINGNVSISFGHMTGKIEYNDDTFSNLGDVDLDENLLIISTGIALKIQMTNNQWKKEMQYNQIELENIHLQNILTEKTKSDMNAYKGILYSGASINSYLGFFIRKDKTIVGLVSNITPIFWKDQYLGSIIISKKIIKNNRNGQLH